MTIIKVTYKILSYIALQLREEFHQLNLWYFVSFFFGIVIYFKHIYLSLNDNWSMLIVLLVFLVNIIFILPIVKTKLILRFLCICLIFGQLGILVSKYRVLCCKSTNTLKETVVTKFEGIIRQIIPVKQGIVLIIDNLLKLEQIDLDCKKIKITIFSNNNDITNFHLGDKIRLTAKIFPQQKSILPNSFDFDFYMMMSGISASGYAIGLPIIISTNHNRVLSIIEKLRMKIYYRLINVMGITAGSFGAAILIGETKSMPTKIITNIRNSGIAHILSVSGLHLSLVGMIIFYTIRVILNCSNYLSHKLNIKIISAVSAILGAFFYLLISGSHIAATRSFIMTLIVMIAIISERLGSPIRAVMIAAFIILVILPEYIFHPSFQLSFSAVLSLISGYELYIKNKHIITTKSKGLLGVIKLYIVSNIYSSFLAGIVTTTFVIYHFYKFSTYSIIMNLIVVPMMSFIIMPLGIISLVCMPLRVDYIFLLILKFFIKIIIALSTKIVSLPGSICYFGFITNYSLLFFVVGFFWMLLWKTEWRFYGLIFILISFFIMTFSSKPDFIYNDRFKIVGIKNEKAKLELHYKNVVPKFIVDYWISWYGQKKANTVQESIANKDKIFFTQDNKVIALSHTQCHSKADVEIITSSELKCDEYAPLVITNDILKLKDTILIHCNKSKCYIKN